MSVQINLQATMQADKQPETTQQSFALTSQTAEQLTCQLFNYYTRLRENQVPGFSEMPKRFMEVQKTVLAAVECRKDLEKDLHIHQVEDKHYEYISFLMDKNRRLESSLNKMAHKVKQYEETSIEETLSVLRNEEKRVTESEKVQVKQQIDWIRTDLAALKQTMDTELTPSSQEASNGGLREGHQCGDLIKEQWEQVNVIKAQHKVQYEDLLLRQQMAAEVEQRHKVYQQSSNKLNDELLRALQTTCSTTKEDHPSSLLSASEAASERCLAVYEKEILQLKQLQQPKQIESTLIIEQLQSELKLLSSQKSLIENSFKSLSTEKQQLTSELKAQIDKNQLIQKQHVQMHTNIQSQHSKQKEQWQEQLQSVESEIQSLKNTHIQLEVKLAKTEELYRTTKSQLSSKQHQIENIMQQQINTRKEQIETLDQQMEINRSLHMTIAKQQLHISEIQTQLQAQKHAHQSQAQRNQQFTQHSQQLTQQLAQKQVQFLSVTATLSDLQQIGIKKDLELVTQEIEIQKQKQKESEPSKQIESDASEQVKIVSEQLDNKIIELQKAQKVIEELQELIAHNSLVNTEPKVELGDKPDQDPEYDPNETERLTNELGEKQQELSQATQTIQQLKELNQRQNLQIESLQASNLRQKERKDEEVDQLAIELADREEDLRHAKLETQKMEDFISHQQKYKQNEQNKQTSQMQGLREEVAQEINQGWEASLRLLDDLTESITQLIPIN